jgi:hypothetical protein
MTSLSGQLARYTLEIAATDMAWSSRCCVLFNIILQRSGSVAIS